MTRWRPCSRRIGWHLDASTLANWRRDLLTDGQRSRFAELWQLGAEVVQQPSARSWALLFYAVGNMKRSAGNIHPATFAVDLSAPSVDRHVSSVALPDGSAVLRDDSEAALGVLTQVHGLAASTASMVLASLWPRHHATLDRLTRSGCAAFFGFDGAEPPAVGVSGYADWYLPRMSSAADGLGVPLWLLEQGMFASIRTAWPSRPAWPHPDGWNGWLDGFRAKIEPA